MIIITLRDITSLFCVHLTENRREEKRKRDEERKKDDKIAPINAVKSFLPHDYTFAIFIL